MFHPRKVPLPNATITELGITELFYYGLLLPNVAHSFNRHDLILQRIKFHSSVPVENNYLSIAFNIQLFFIVTKLIHFVVFYRLALFLKVALFIIDTAWPVQLVSDICVSYNISADPLDNN